MVRTPPLLKEFAEAAGVEPKAYLADLCRRHETLASAQAEIGVSPETFRRWRRRYRIEVKS